jgi:hypothetical protein
MKRYFFVAICLLVTIANSFQASAQCPTPNWGSPVLKNDNGTAVTLPIQPNTKYRLELTLNAPAPSGLVRIDIVSADGFGFIMGVNPDGSDGPLLTIPPNAIGKDVQYVNFNLVVPVKVTFSIKTFSDFDLGPYLYFRYRSRCSPISGGTYQYGPNNSNQIATGR